MADDKLKDNVNKKSSPKGAAPSTDQRIRLDGEEDTLYEDGLETEDDSRPLTGIDGRDDSIPEG